MGAALPQPNRRPAVVAHVELASVSQAQAPGPGPVPVPRRSWLAPFAHSSLALLCGAVGLALAHQYPLAPWGAPLLFMACAAAFATWPAAWPLVLPALLPIVGLAPWTGWLTFEVDLP